MTYENGKYYIQAGADTASKKQLGNTDLLKSEKYVRILASAGMASGYMGENGSSLSYTITDEDAKKYSCLLLITGEHCGTNFCISTFNLSIPDNAICIFKNSYTAQGYSSSFTQTRGDRLYIIPPTSGNKVSLTVKGAYSFFLYGILN